MNHTITLRRLSGVAAVAFMACALVGCATGGGAANPLVGTWNFTVESQLPTFTQVVKINDDMTGMITMTEPEAEIVPSNIMLDGDKVTFDIVFDIEGQELEAQFVGTLDGDSLTGEYVTDLGNGTVTGTRAE